MPNLLATSLTTHSTIDNELFPLLNVQCCVSEARESRNGPRFSGQDIVNGTVYEVRCRRITSGSEAATSPTQKGALLAAQARIDELMAASAKVGGHSVPRSVLLPVDVYIQEQPSTGAAFVVSVEPFSGLSLGDIVRSGWTVVDENTFLDVLQAAEEFGKASATLPPHGNLSTDSLKQVLLVRDGATETHCPSRWVISDWLLTPDHAALDAEATGDQLLQDLEWLLHSCFSMLNVTSSQDGVFLAATEVEDAINAMIDRVRHHLSMSGAAPKRKDTESQSAAGDKASGSARRQIRGPHGALVRASRLLEETAMLTISEKIAFHQNALRAEQVVVQRHRRKRGQLPPLAQQPAGSPGLGVAGRAPGAPAAAALSAPRTPRDVSSGAGRDFTTEATRTASDDYELRYLSSPLVVKPSQLLTSQSSRTAAPDRAAITREEVLNLVVDIAIRDRERKDELLRVVEVQERAERDALRAKIAPVTPVKRHSDAGTQVGEGRGAPRASSLTPSTQQDRAAARRAAAGPGCGGTGGGAAADTPSTRGAPVAAAPGTLTSARRFVDPPVPNTMPPATTQTTPVRGDDVNRSAAAVEPAGGESAPQTVVAPKGGSTRARSVSKPGGDAPRRSRSVGLYEQSPEPRPPTPLSRPILKSVKPPAPTARFGLAMETPSRKRPQSASVMAPNRRAIPVHLTEKRRAPLVNIPTTSARPAATAPMPTTQSHSTTRHPHPKSGAPTAPTVPAQRVELRREPQRRVPPGRPTEPVAAAYPFIKPLALHKLQVLEEPADEDTLKQGRSVQHSPRAQTARLRPKDNAYPVKTGGTPLPQTAREPLIRQHSGAQRRLSPRSPRSPRDAACAQPRGSGGPSSPRQPWNNSPRFKRATSVRNGGLPTTAPTRSGGHPHCVGGTPRDKRSPATKDRHNGSGSPRLSGSAAALQSTPRASPTKPNQRVSAHASTGSPITKTRPVVSTVQRKTRRVSAPDAGSTEHLARGAVYAVNETSVGIGLRLARMQSGPL